MNAVSYSYGASEYGSETFDEATYYNHPGIAVTVSSGDNGYGVEFPAVSRYVTAVGGTTLTQTSNTGTRNGTETAWTGAGSGCSAFIAKPAWQNGLRLRGAHRCRCVGRGRSEYRLWVYDSTPVNSQSGWLVVA